MLTSEQIASLDYAKSGGLLPAIVQCADSARVLMLGYVNEAALLQTHQSGHITFYSRSKQRLWTKGETSGHWLKLVDSFIDCDADTVLFFARPQGPSCHNGTTTCFDTPASDVHVGNVVAPTLSFLGDLDRLIAERKVQLPEGSYTTRLFQGELRRIAQKVGEEGVETALAAVSQDSQALLGEAADLLFHLLVLLRAKDLGLAELTQVLRSRHPNSSPR
jgi:phosphoribosyl-AMP cyclohydrolase / phosphoribosyl-ATP pyrophosphohydrolase